MVYTVLPEQDTRKLDQETRLLLNDSFTDLSISLVFYAALKHISLVRQRPAFCGGGNQALSCKKYDPSQVAATPPDIVPERNSA